jgi:hypothetical protein
MLICPDDLFMRHKDASPRFSLDKPGVYPMSILRDALHVRLWFFLFLHVALTHLASSHSSVITLFLVSCNRRS